MNKPERNAPCPCGSGKKYQECCLTKDSAAHAASRWGSMSQPYQTGHYKLTPGTAHVAAATRPSAPGATTSGSFKQPMRELGNADAQYNLGNKLLIAGRLDEAISSYRKAISMHPNFAKAHCNLGLALKAQDNLDGAIASYRAAIALEPNFALAHYNLGNALQVTGNVQEAIASYGKALSLKPDYVDAYTNLLFNYAYHALLSPQEYLALARGWERACVPEMARQAAQGKRFGRAPLAGRLLKIGYVSGDFREHAVSYFVEQLFTHHDRSRVEVHAYSIYGQRDAVTDRLQALVEHWIPVEGSTDAAFMSRIESDEIDVLVDLSGHTGPNRMTVFARRAAPVQAHYLGYCASTGVSEMDYWIGDEILTPPQTDSHFSERVWRLPRVWVSYDGKKEAPVSGWGSDPDGTVWVGSFNNLGKLTPATFALWARVLHALPEGRLLLKTRELADAGNRQRVLDVMAGHGIPASRIELQSRNVTPGWKEHMAYYDRLDIALDPIGAMGGGTTTCDALWMGVPVIALEGDRMASRMTAAMLNAIGHLEWVAGSDEEYVGKVVALARDVALRKILRPAQRERMSASPLCDAKGLAACLEDAYIEMYGQWQIDQGRQS
ncbi:MAG: tetratricopeptide repeat protein [Gammaproteobacteria bacterium]|nr:tetratricopeptide repeat protein [Gammaproteobacteria bacterium]